MIGIGELALSDHRSSQPTRDELLRIASDAHVAGMISGKAGIVHLHLGDGERGHHAECEHHGRQDPQGQCVYTSSVISLGSGNGLSSAKLTD